MRFDADLAAAYNHDSFAPGDFERFWCYESTPQLGGPAPDFPLWHLDRDEQTTLHAELARQPITVVEFGSISCPLSRMACDPLEEIADNYSEEHVGALFIYTHEAHPAEHAPVHRSWEDKLAAARRLRQVTNPVRPILVDALDGPCHRAFGALPNLAWIFSERAEPLYKAEWAEAASVEFALRYQLAFKRDLGEHEAVLLGSSEMVTGVRFDTREHDCIMEESGEKALGDFRNAFGQWPERVMWPSRMVKPQD